MRWTRGVFDLRRCLLGTVGAATLVGSAASASVAGRADSSPDSPPGTTEPASTEPASTEPASTPPDVRSLDELLEQFKQSPGLSARFEEDKRIALLEAPLKSTGALYFLPKDKLARHVERPRRSVLLLEGTQLRIADDSGTRKLDLARTPALAALVQSFAQVLRGDRSALDENYRVDFRAEASSKDEGRRTAPWQLRLTPRGEPLNKMVSSIELTGTGATIGTLTVSEPNGDRSVTRFSDVDARRRFSEAERRRLFTLP